MTPCPSPERLEQFLGDRLSTAESAALDEHLADCTSCQDVLGQLTQDADEDPWRRLSTNRRQGGPVPPTAFLEELPDRLRARLENDEVSTGDTKPRESLKGVTGRLVPPDPSTVDRAGGTEDGSLSPAGLPVVAGYKIEREVGRGGMGVVYLARDQRLGRRVALKMLLAGALAGDKERARFRAEAEAAARLQHANIVQVYEVGEQDGRPYLALEYVDSGSLKEQFRGTPQPARAAAELVEVLARAIHHAHQHGIVHRDLKPSNILLQRQPKPEIRRPKGSPQPLSRVDDDFGFRLSDFVPKITDFGLAKRLNGGAVLTGSRTLVGTPTYMAPEQAEARRTEIGPATDVYALGVLLHEFLTGRPPFLGETVLDTLLQALRADPIPPSRLRPGLSRDLETICLQCLKKEPGKRYASALELADDLARFLKGEPVRARPVGPAERSWRWGRRNPVVAGLLAALAAVVVLGFGLVTWKWLEADTERSQAEQARTEAEQLRHKAERGENLLAVDKALGLCEHGESGCGLLRLVQTLEFAVRDGNSDLENAIRINLADWSRQISIPGPLFSQERRPTSEPSHEVAVAFRPDGKAALIAAGFHARQWDLATAQPFGPRLGLGLQELWRTVYAVAYSPDGRTALLAKGGGNVGLWDLATGRRLRAFLTGVGDTWSAVFSPDGQTVAAGYTDKQGPALQLWETATGRPRFHEPLRPSAIVLGVAFSPDGQTLLTGAQRNKQGSAQAQLWDAATGKLKAPTFVHRDDINAVAFSPDGRTALVGCRDGTARFWDVQTGRSPEPTLRHGDSIQRVVFSPDGRTVLTGSRDRRAQLWDTATCQPLGPCLRHNQEVDAAAFSPDGLTFLIGSGDGVVRLWRLPRGQALGPALKHPHRVVAVAFGPDGRTIRTATEFGMHRWDMATWRSSPPWVMPRLEAVAFGPQVDCLAVASGGEFAVQLGELAPGNPADLRSQLPYLEPEVFATQLAFNPDGRTLLMVGSPWKGAQSAQEVRFWDAGARRPLPRSLPHPAPIECLALSPDGWILVTGCRDRMVRVWDLTTDEAIGAPLAHAQEIQVVACSPDDRTIVTGCRDGTVRLWDVVTGRPRERQLQSPGLLLAAAFSPDGKFLATGSVDRTARLWDLATGLPLGPPLQHLGAVQAVAFSADGRTVVTGSHDRTARLWAAPSPPLKGTVAQLRCWAEVLTGMELDADGTAHPLEDAALAERRRILADPANADFARPLTTGVASGGVDPRSLGRFQLHAAPFGLTTTCPPEPGQNPIGVANSGLHQGAGSNGLDKRLQLPLHQRPTPGKEVGVCPLRVRPSDAAG
jgi:WD40 repeat protein/serine/threonine protein kinase